jgi:hypothetical protein
MNIIYDSTSQTSEEQNGGNQMKINLSRTCLSVDVDVHPQKYTFTYEDREPVG